MLGKIEGGRRRGRQRGRWLDGITDSMGMILSNPRWWTLACCSPWGRKEWDTTEQLNWSDLRLIIAFLPRSNCLLILWLQSPSAVIFEPKKIVCHCFHCFPIYFHEVMGPDAMILVFWMLSFKPSFSLSSFTFIKRLFSSSLLSTIRVVLFAYLRLLIFFPEILIPAYVSSSPAFLILCI